MVHEAREFLSPRYEREKEKEKAVISKWLERNGVVKCKLCCFKCKCWYILKVISLSIHTCDSNMMGGGGVLALT